MIGGEGNGGVIDPRVVLVRDSFVGMALVLDAMAARQEKISRLADELPRYKIVKTKISLAPGRSWPAWPPSENTFADAKSDRMDGLSLDWPGRWLLVRASNTEPIVRAIAEAPTTAEARSAMRRCRPSAGQSLEATCHTSPQRKQGFWTSLAKKNASAAQARPHQS